MLLLIVKIVLLLAAVVSGLCGLAMIFFYDRFKAMNDGLNDRYLVGKGKYGSGSGYALDSWVLGWRIVPGLLILLISLWLFSVFFQYLSM